LQFYRWPSYWVYRNWFWIAFIRSYCSLHTEFPVMRARRRKLLELSVPLGTDYPRFEESLRSKRDKAPSYPLVVESDTLATPLSKRYTRQDQNPMGYPWTNISVQVVSGVRGRHWRIASTFNNIYCAYIFI